MRPNDTLYTEMVALSAGALASTTPLDATASVVGPRGGLVAAAGADSVEVLRPDDGGRLSAAGPPIPRAGATQLALSPDESMLAVVDETAFHLYSVSDPVRPLPLGSGTTTPHGSVLAAVFSPDRTTIALGHEDGTISLWSLTDPDAPTALGVAYRHTAEVISLAFSDDGRLLASGSIDGTMDLWRASPDSLEPLAETRTGTTYVTALAFGPDGRTLAVGNALGVTVLWDTTKADSPVELSELARHDNTVSAVAFSQDGSVLATGSYDQSIVLTDVSDPDDPVRLGDPLRGHGSDVESVAFSAKGILTSTDGVSARRWQLPDVVTEVSDQVMGVAVSPDGRVLASVGIDGLLRLWHLDSPGLQLAAAARPGHGELADVAFAPGGDLVAAAGFDGAVTVWDVSSAADPRIVAGPVAPSGITDGTSSLLVQATFAPDGRTVVTSGPDERVRLWDTTVPARTRQLGAALDADDGGFVATVVVSPDSRTLVAAGASGEARFWDISDPGSPAEYGEPVPMHDNALLRAAFGPDGSTLYTASADLSVGVWDVTDPASVTRLSTIGGVHRTVPRVVAPSPLGTEIAIGLDDGEVQLWDLTDPRNPRAVGTSLNLLAGGMRDLTFAPDGHTLLAASSASTIQRWHLDVVAVAARICTAGAGSLTPDLWTRLVSEDREFAPPCSS